MSTLSFLTLCLFVYDGRAPSKDRPTSDSGRLEIFLQISCRKKKILAFLFSRNHGERLQRIVYDFIRRSYISGRKHRDDGRTAHTKGKLPSLDGGRPPILSAAVSRWPIKFELPIYELAKKKT